MRTLKEIWQFSQSKAEIAPPSPDEIALRLAAALMASGQYDAANYSAAVEAAWWAVPEFYRGRLLWQTTIFPTMFGGGGLSPEPDMTAAEAASYVSGGDGDHHAAGLPSGAH